MLAKLMTLTLSSLGIFVILSPKKSWKVNLAASGRCLQKQRPFLFNGAGFPAVPFRTDHWPGVTETKMGNETS